MDDRPEAVVSLRRRTIATAVAAATGCALLGVPGGRARAAAPSWPELALRTTAGRLLVDAAAGVRATYVDFWASWCAPCRLSFQWMNEMHEKLGPAGLRIVAVNIDRKEADARRFLEQWPARFEIAFDAAAESARRLDIQAMPTSVLVDADRRIVHTHRGFRQEDRAPLEARLRSALT